MQLAQVTTLIELTISVGATPLVFLVIYALLSSSLNRGVKVFLTMNGLGLLFLATSHVSVAIYRLIRPGEWKGQDGPSGITTEEWITRAQKNSFLAVVANVPLFLHQLAYSSCTVAQFLITIERMIIGLKPRLYVEKRVQQWSLITVCVLFEVLHFFEILYIFLSLSNKQWKTPRVGKTFSLDKHVGIALPCTMLFQDGPVINGHKLYVATELSQKISLLLLFLLDVIALLMVILSFVNSSKRYNRHFSNATLGTRYQIKEVISLTRVLIPICCSSLIFKFAVLILAYFAFGDHQILDLLFTIIRFCCTATAIVEPILLLTRHRLLQRRVRKLFGLSVGEVIQADVRDSVAIADVYFDAFNKDLRRKRTA